MAPKPRSRRGFTLLELLAVIAIIAIIAAFLFPVFAQAREKGRAAACLSNTKQIALAFSMYTQDHDERAPGGCFANYGCRASPTLWIDETGAPSKTEVGFTGLWPLTPYVKNEGVFACPSWAWNDSRRRPRVASYASNRTATQDGNSLASFDHPSRTVAYLDARVPWIDDLPGYYVHCRIGRGEYCEQFDFPATRCTVCSTGLATDWHNAGINVVYLDSHAKWSKPSQLTYSMFLVGPQRGLAVTDRKYHCPINVFPTQCNHPGP